MGLATATGKPAEIRQEVLEALRKCAQSDQAGWYSVTRCAAGFRVSGIHIIGLAPAVVEKVWGFAGERLGRVVAPYSDLFLRPPGQWTRRFGRLSETFDVDEFKETPIWKNVFMPARLEHQLRLYAVHGENFLGYLGALRGVAEPDFSPGDQRRTDALRDWLVNLLGAAEVLERAGLPSEPAFLIVTPGGKVEHATVSARGWLARDGFLTALALAVREWDRLAPIEAPDVLERAEARLTRLDLGGGVRYLVQLRPVPSPMWPSRQSEQLSAAQRDVAGYAAAGATVSEIATALGRSESTVKSHLREAYRRLGVSSRVELARALEDEPTIAPPLSEASRRILPK